MSLYRKAQQAYDRAIQKGGSEVQNYFGLAQVEARLLNMKRDTSEVKQYFEKGNLACEKALTVRPDSAEAYRWYGRVYFRYNRTKDQNSNLDLLNRSIELHRKALALSPYDPDTLYSLGTVIRIRGIYEREHGQNPAKTYDEAL